MIRHIVFFNFKEEACGRIREQNIAQAKQMLDNLVGRVPTLLSMSCGASAVRSATAWDFALVAEFADESALQQYIVHPEHKKVSEFMSQVRSDRASVDYVI